MSDHIQTDEATGEPLVDGLTRQQWVTVLRTLTADPGWLLTVSLMSEAVNTASSTMFNSPEPERQNALHEAIGFIKFANMLDEIKNRARIISERGVSPDAAIRERPV